MARLLIGTAVADRIDCLWVSAPSMFFIPLAVSAGRRGRFPVVVDVRDLTWDYATDVARTRGMAYRVPAAVTARWMRASLRRADLVLVTNDGARESIAAGGTDEHRVLVMPNGIDRARVEAITSMMDEGDSPGKSRTRPLVTYCGLVGMTQGLGTLLNVAESLPEVDFKVAGHGPEQQSLKAMARSRRLSNIEFTGQLDWPRVLRLYRDSDILFAQLLGHAALEGTAIPSKLFEYMATGRPVIYSGGGVAAQRVRETGAGLVTPPDDVEEIAGAIHTLLGDPTRRRAMGRAGRQSALSQVREDIAERLVPEVLARLGA